MRKIRKDEFEAAAKLMADCFFEYPLYDVLFPNEKTRWKGIYCSFLVRLHTRMDYTYVDDDMKVVIQVKRPGDVEQPLTSVLKNVPLLAKVLKAMPPRTIKRMLDFGRMDDEALKKHYNPEKDDYVQVICCDKEVRGTRLGQAIEFIKSPNPVYCETHDPRDVRLYGLLGFDVVEEIDWRGVTQHCMRAQEIKRRRRKKETE